MRKYKESQLSHRKKNNIFKNEKREKKIDIETELNQSIVTFHQGLLKFLMAFSAFNIVYVLSKNDHEKLFLNTKYLIFLFLQVFFIATGMVLIKKKSRHAEKIAFLLCLIIVVNIYETKRDFMSWWTKELVFIYGSAIEALIISLPMARVSWKYLSLMMLILSVLYVTRYMDYDENVRLNYTPVSFFFVNFFWIWFCSFKMERHENKYFIELKKYIQSQKRFENLLTDVLPVAIMIVSKGKVIFTNNKLEKMFRASRSDRILNITNNIRIIEGLDHLSCVYDDEKLDEEHMKKMENKRRLLQKSARDGKLSTLFELITKEFSEPKKYLGVFLNDAKGEDGIHIEEAHFAENKDILTEEEIFVDISVSQSIWNNEEALFVFINENMMAQKINELNRQAIYKDKLLATVSHNLRTPLNGIIGMIKLVLEKIKDQFVQENLSIAERSSQLLLNMINDILDLSQISRGKLRLNLTTFAIKDIIEKASELISFQSKNKGLEFFIENDSSSGKNCLVRSDPIRLRQIILNLLGNALKFTEKGFIKISFQKCAEPHGVPLDLEENLENNEKFPNGCYLIKVEDSGCGIKKEDIPKLFKLFGKLESEDSKRVNQTGVGLGLSISQNLVKMLNSNKPGFQIAVDSEVGRGSCFSFYLSSFSELQVDGNEEAAKANSLFVCQIPLFSSNKNPNTDIRISNKKTNILVVEDDQINIMVLKSYLRTFGNTTYDLALNGLEALKKVQESASFEYFYDLILMDCNMPIMDGFQATKEILKYLSDNKKPPVVIVAMTANVSPLDHQNCFTAGMKDYISKPFTKETIRQIISKHCKN